MSTAVRLNKFKYLLLLLLLAYTGLSLTARYFLLDINPLILSLQKEVKAKTDLTLKFDSVEARWIFFSPVLEINNIYILNPQGESVFYVGEIFAEVDVLESIINLQPRLNKLKFKKGSFGVFQDENGITLKGLDLKGLMANNASRAQTDNVDQMFQNYVLSIDEILLENILIDLATKDIPNGSVDIKNFYLAGGVFGHNLSTSFQLNDGKTAPRNLIFRSNFYGNPTKLESFSSENYLKVPSSDFSAWLPDKEYEGFIVNELQLGGELWISVRNGEVFRLQGMLEDGEVSFIARSGEILDEIQNLNLSFDWKGYLDDQWRMKIGELGFDWKGIEYRHLGLMLGHSAVKSTLEPLRKSWGEFDVIPKDDFSQAKNNQEIENTNISKKQDMSLDGADVFALTRIYADYLPISLVNSSVELIGNLTEEQRDLIHTADLSGVVEGLQIVLLESVEGKLDIFSSAYFSDISLSEVKKVPAIQGADFYAEWAPGVLGIELSSKDILLSKNRNLFRQDILVEKLDGYLLGEVIDGDFLLYSNALNAKTERQRAEGYFALDVPNRKYLDGEKEIPLWSLHAWVSEEAAQESLKFFPEKLPTGFINWIDSAVKGGEVSGNVFLMAFGKKRLPDTFVTFDAKMDVNNLNLDYMPGIWPEVKGVDGEVRAHNESVVADVSDAYMFDSRMSGGTIRIPSYLSKDKPIVFIEGEVSGPVVDIKSLFQKSVLSESLGNVVASWELTGDYKTDVNFQFPLISGVQNQQSKVYLDGSLENVSLNLTGPQLKLDSLSGDIKYSLDEGLFSDQLKGELFSQEVLMAINTEKVSSFGEVVDLTRIEAKSSVEMDDLREWLDLWILDAVQGELSYTAQLNIGPFAAINAMEQNSGEISAEPKLESEQFATQIILETDLKGSAIDFPFPYGKESDEIKTTSLALNIFEDTVVYELAYGSAEGDPINLIADFIDNELHSIALNFGPQEPILRAQPGLEVSGYITSFDYEVWNSYFEKYFESNQETIQVAKEISDQKSDVGDGNRQEPEETDPNEILRKVELTLGEFIGFNQYFENIKTVVTRENKKWKIEVDNPIIAGYFLVPDEDKINRENPIVAELKYLRIDENQFAKEKASGDQEKGNGSSKLNEEVDEDLGLQPSDFVDIKLLVKSISINGEKHGRWELDLFPDEQGLDFEVHQLHFGLVSVNGVGRWEYSTEESKTRFKGHMRTGAISNLFTALKLKPSSKSNGLMALNIHWPGDPISFDPDKMKGKVGLEIFDGSIIELDVKSKKIKALGIFNLGFINDVVTLKVFKKIGKGLKIDKLLGLEEEDEDKEE